jgi:GH24 family phage-related lysozyme (muramidase)
MTTTTDLDWTELRADFDLWEGRIPHMYLDTRGLVTVGVGKMLPNVAAAQALPFVRRDNGAPARPDEIQRDYDAVKAQPKAMLAGSYRKFTQLDLPDAAIDALLKTTADQFIADLAARFAGWAGYPAPAKRALIDMAYNLGIGGLMAFVRLKAAVEARRWDVAADECARNGISPDRNSWTRNLFLACRS